MDMLHKIFWNFINAVTRYDCHDYIDRKMWNQSKNAYAMILVGYCLKLGATACDEKFLICRFLRKIYQMISWINCKAQIKNKKKIRRFSENTATVLDRFLYLLYFFIAILYNEFKYNWFYIIMGITAIVIAVVRETY